VGEIGMSKKEGEDGDGSGREGERGMGEWVWEGERGIGVGEWSGGVGVGVGE
jgi:hypothetical protein